MTMRSLVWGDLKRLADHDRNDEAELTELLSWESEMTIEELEEALYEVARIKRVAAILKTSIEAGILTDVQKHGAIRLGSTGYYDGKKGGKKLIDSDGLLRWLLSAGDPYLIIRGAVRLTDNVRSTALESIAEERGEDFGAISSTFYEMPGGDERELKTVPASRAKWVERLEAGQRRPPKRSGNGK